MIKKKILSGSIALFMACTLIPSTSAFACTTVLVGKGATADGSTIIARSEDADTANPKRVVVHPATTNPEGAVFESKVNNFKIELPKDAQKYTATPEYTDEYGLFEEAGTNTSGVAMSATESTEYNDKVKKLDPLDTENGIGEECMLTVVLPYVNSAREACTYLGDIVTKYGAAECNGIAFSDRDEVWWFEIVSGHHWVAVRIPDSKYAVIANQMSNADIDLSKTDSFMADSELTKFIEDNKLAKSGTKFNIRDTFGTNSKDDAKYNICRVWDGQRLLTKSVGKKYSITSKKLPFLQKADEKVKVADVAKVLRSHFNGTDYDPYETAKGQYRPIMVQANVESHIIQWRQDMPVQISGLQWEAIGTSEHSIFVPMYSGINDVAPRYKNEVNLTPTYDNAYWIFKATDVLSTPYYETYMKKYVHPAFEKIEKKLNENIEASDRAALEMYQSNPADTEALENYLTGETVKNMDYTLDKVVKLNNKMFIKSTNSRNSLQNKNL